MISIMIYLPLSKSSWIEGRIGKEKYQDYFQIVKKSIYLINKNKKNETLDKILLLSDFKSKKAEKSELDNMINICDKFKVDIENLIIEKYGYDTLSQLRYTFDFCKKNNNDLTIISSLTHYPRVVWISWKLNKKYKIKYKNKIGFGIPRIHDVVYDIVLIFIYPIIDLLGYSEKFSSIIQRRRNKGFL